MSKLFESIFTPGPIVVETEMFLTYFPLTTAGFDFNISETKASKFSINFLLSNDTDRLHLAE